MGLSRASSSFLLSASVTLVACTSQIAPAGGGGGPTGLDAGIEVGGGAPPSDSGLPIVPVMTHVGAVVHGTSADISFDPVPGAVDYRVYELPSKPDIRLNADGTLAGITNATYRCAGQRAAPGVWVDGSAGPDNIPDWVAVKTWVATGINGYTRTTDEAILGYGFSDPVSGTVAVYAMGDPSNLAENYGYGIREPATRAKLYVTDKTSLASSGWRDDAVAFYAMAAPTPSVCGGSSPVAIHTVDVADASGMDHLYYASAPEVGSRGGGTTAFYLCPNQVAGSLPVMRVFVELGSPGGIFGGHTGHDELALGQDRFNRARCQAGTFGPCAGNSRSLWQVHWAGITKATTLIVEALDAGCPFQGLFGANPLAPKPVSPGDNGGNASLMNDPVFTFAQLQAAAPNGEVYLNGTWDGAPTPHPIARAAIDLVPQLRETMDFASDFARSPETFTELLNADGTPNCGLTPALRSMAGNPDTCDGGHRFDSPTYDVLMMDMDDGRYTLGVSKGELWTAYSGGKFRITPKAVTATLSDTAFLHAVLEVSGFSTGRRYPQIWVTTQDMVTSQWLLNRSATLANDNIQQALVVNPIDSGVGRPIFELELCNTRLWQVNDHCPWFLLEKNDPSGDKGNNNPHLDLFDRMQDDRSMRLDVFLSTQKAYVYVDARPYGCVDLAHRSSTSLTGTVITPAPRPPPAGPVTVAFGDVEYHAGAEPDYFTLFSPFHLNHELYETVRHFDYIAFKSNVSAPPWDEVASPCTTRLIQGGGAGTQTPEGGN